MADAGIADALRTAIAHFHAMSAERDNLCQVHGSAVADFHRRPWCSERVEACKLAQENVYQADARFITARNIMAAAFKAFSGLECLPPRRQEEL